MGEEAIRAKYKSYFDGSIFTEETSPLEYGSTEDEPESYPVGINLVKMLCEAQADSEFGEWEDTIVSFEPSQDEEVGSPQKAAADIASKILETSNAPSMLWETSLHRNIYGGSPIQIVPAISSPGWIKWVRVPIEGFYPIWDTEDIDELLEVYIVTGMTKEQAKAKYGYDGDEQPYVTRVDHWTRAFYESKLEGKRISAHSGINPWGFIPFEFIPRMRSTHWWGDSLTQDLIRVQDELNLRIADLGDAINYNSHPIRWGLNMPRGFNSDNYPVGPNILWDLGRQSGDQEPKVGILEAEKAIPEGAFEYIKFLYDWARTSVFAPPIAFGEDSGGGQRSGVTLEIRMWPLIKATRRSRAYYRTGLKRLLKKSGLILRQKGLGPTRAVDAMINAEVLPRFHPIMPRDQAKIVDEVTKRFSTTPPSISLETAVKKLGDGTAEVERIKEMLEDDDLYQRSAGTLALEGQEMAQENAMEMADKQAEQKKVAGQDGATGADDTTNSEESED